MQTNEWYYQILKQVGMPIRCWNFIELDEAMRFISSSSFRLCPFFSEDSEAPARSLRHVMSEPMIVDEEGSCRAAGHGHTNSKRDTRVPFHDNLPFVLTRGLRFFCRQCTSLPLV